MAEGVADSIIARKRRSTSGRRLRVSADSSFGINCSTTAVTPSPLTRAAIR